jgi:hypothetical protein
VRPRSVSCSDRELEVRAWGEEVPLDDIGTGATSITFRAHLLKRSSKGYQPFFPRNDGTLSAIHIPLSSKELLLQLNDHRV